MSTPNEQSPSRPSSESDPLSLLSRFESEAADLLRTQRSLGASYAHPLSFPRQSHSENAPPRLELIGIQWRKYAPGFLLRFLTWCLGLVGIRSNVKEHAPLSAGARVDHGVDVETTEDHVNRAADRGCCVSSCSPLMILLYRYRMHPQTS